jgi:hypothetical protein
MTEIDSSSRTAAAAQQQHPQPTERNNFNWSEAYQFDTNVAFSKPADCVATTQAFAAAVAAAMV